SRCLFCEYHSFRNRVSSIQFGHQVPKIWRMTTLFLYFSSVGLTRLPSRSGKLASMVWIPSLSDVNSSGFWSTTFSSRVPVHFLCRVVPDQKSPTKVESLVLVAVKR